MFDRLALGRPGCLVHAAIMAAGDALGAAEACLHALSCTCSRARVRLYRVAQAWADYRKRVWEAAWSQ